MSDLKLWHLSQTANTGWDTYDSAVVAAANEEAARLIHPDDFGFPGLDNWAYRHSPWAPTPDQVTVRYLGIAAEGVEPGVICASFNAG